jgi:hypothetical protein
VDKLSGLGTSNSHFGRHFGRANDVPKNGLNAPVTEDRTSNSHKIDKKVSLKK